MRAATGLQKLDLKFHSKIKMMAFFSLVAKTISDYLLKHGGPRFTQVMKLTGKTFNLKAILVIQIKKDMKLIFLFIMLMRKT